MNNFFKSVLLFFLCLFAASCSKSDSSTEPLRDYAQQYAKDNENIVAFMKSHYMTVVHNPSGNDDLDVVFTKIPENGPQVSIWDQTEYPIDTHVVTIKQNDTNVTYTIYYIALRGKIDRSTSPAEELEKAPCNVDNVLAAYRGEYIYNGTEGIISKQFEESNNPETYFNLYGGVIRGWTEIFPNFRAGSYISNSDGTVSFSNFGAGIMFLPSGLAYYSGTGGSSTFPAYSPLIFTFKLLEIKRNDQDSDGIPSYLEDLNNDGYMATLETGVSNPDNTDQDKVMMPNGKYTRNDEIPDFLDVDDDGDEILTKIEIKNPATGLAYPFADIPTCGSSGNGKKRHLDPSCH
ncbi:FKBP-type peptidyl-prolyl cis-trans isomerase [Flavobacterium phycosphaerae]|uniref:FKBP-type peptidyl-prolyl cis-trans isomerase n=1 Tax=Flavobacterium phycosphaerae TaxID=2697515 RepID=UPI00138ACF4D|nr:FKBP-type peptidylprolyl isomerase [Flavobacterium phycosphaerae]